LQTLARDRRREGAPFGRYTNLLNSHDQSDRVVGALRNHLFGSAVLASVSALPFTIFSTVGLTIAGYPSEKKADCSLRGVRSEPTPAPIKAKPAEQKYHDEDDQ
jgi:hypothetical protein